jgi:hypothetical protein
VQRAEARRGGEERAQRGRVSEKCLGTEVPVDCKSVRIRLMASQGCDEINLLQSEGPWVYKGAHPGGQNGNPSSYECGPKSPAMENIFNRINSMPKGCYKLGPVLLSRFKSPTYLAYAH